ncbi:MFS transporter [Paenibacillus sp. GCM10023252]|uniref:MFS transporter n=1 Tax=Paenibacillus sp. GCM10023252 TaxID=3252649 RepID=UPI00360D675D
MSTKASTAGGSLFSNKFYQTILLSNILLQIGIWVRNFAILMYVTDKTDSDPIAISLISVVEFAPIFVFSIIGGTFADRWRPRLTMIWCDLLSAVSVFVVLITLYYGSWEMIYFATFISAILSQFSQPSAMKLFKQHIPQEQLQQAMALFQSMMGIFMVFGPALGIYVYQKFDIIPSIAVMGVAFLLSALVLLRLPSDKKEAKSATDAEPGASSTPSAPMANFKAELADGLRYVMRSMTLKILGGTFALAGLAVGIIQTLGIFIVTDRLGEPKEFLQFIMMVYGISMLVGSGGVMVLAKKISPQKLLALGMLVNGATIIGIGMSTNTTITLILQFFAGLTMPCIQIGINTLILQSTEEAYVGRVNGVLNPLFMGMMVIMMAVSGPALKVFSLVSIYTVSGVLMLLGMLLLVPLFKLKHEPMTQPQPVSREASH